MTLLTFYNPQNECCSKFTATTNRQMKEDVVPSLGFATACGWGQARFKNNPGPMKSARFFGSQACTRIDAANSLRKAAIGPAHGAEASHCLHRGLRRNEDEVGQSLSGGEERRVLS